VVLSAGARTVRDLGAGAAPSLHVFERYVTGVEVFFAGNPDFVSRKGPRRGGDIMGMFWRQQTTQDVSKRCRDEER
jgi:hypothetical protein